MSRVMTRLLPNTDGLDLNEVCGWLRDKGNLKESEVGFKAIECSFIYGSSLYNTQIT